MSIGVDIVRIERLNLNREKDGKFLSDIFTEKELDYCYSKKAHAIHLAGKFAAKEAIIKALWSLDITDKSPGKIEILNNEKGIPRAHVEGCDNLNIEVSISHDGDYAIAFATIR